MIIYKKGLLNMSKIREGINAFMMVAHEKKENTPADQDTFAALSQNIDLDEKTIDRALMYVNMTLSQDLIREWIEKCKDMLECEDRNVKKFEQYYK